MKKFILSLASLIVILGSTHPHIIGNKDDKVLDSNKNNIIVANTITKDNTSYASLNEDLRSTSSVNKVEKTSICSTNNVKFNNMLVHSLIHDITLKDSKDSNINITLNCIGEGKDKEKINQIFKEVDLKIAEENNQYAPTIYRNGENLIITKDEMKNIDYIYFNLIIEIPKNLKSMTLSNWGSINFESLNLDTLEISSRGNVTGSSINAKKCNLFAYNGSIEVNSLTCDVLQIRTNTKLKCEKIASKDCNIIAHKALVDIDHLNSDVLYIRTENKLKSKEITSKDFTLVNKKGVIEVDKFNCDKLIN